jgi:hypothetical protein
MLIAVGTLTNAALLSRKKFADLHYRCLQGVASSIICTPCAQVLNNQPNGHGDHGEDRYFNRQHYCFQPVERPPLHDKDIFAEESLKRTSSEQ